jgi:hypothetical protein
MTGWARPVPWMLREAQPKIPSTNWCTANGAPPREPALQDSDLGVVADHEPVRPGLAMIAADRHVAAQQ